MSVAWQDYTYESSQEAISIEAAEVGREFNRGVDGLVELLDVILCAAMSLVCGAAVLPCIAFIGSLVSDWWRGQ